MKYKWNTVIDSLLNKKIGDYINAVMKAWISSSSMSGTAKSLYADIFDDYATLLGAYNSDIIGEWEDEGACLAFAVKFVKQRADKYLPFMYMYDDKYLLNIPEYRTYTTTHKRMDEESPTTTGTSFDINSPSYKSKSENGREEKFPYEVMARIRNILGDDIRNLYEKCVYPICEDFVKLW